MAWVQGECCQGNGTRRCRQPWAPATPLAPAAPPVHRSIKNQYILGDTEVELVPTKHHWRCIDLCYAFEDALFQIVFGCDPDVPQECARHLGEGALDQVEPRAMLGRMHILEAPGARAEIGHSLLGDVGRAS